MLKVSKHRGAWQDLVCGLNPGIDQIMILLRTNFMVQKRKKSKQKPTSLMYM